MSAMELKGTPVTIDTVVAAKPANKGKADVDENSTPGSTEYDNTSSIANAEASEPLRLPVARKTADASEQSASNAIAADQDAEGAADFPTLLTRPPPGLDDLSPKPAQAQAVTVLGYGPHGSPKRVPRSVSAAPPPLAAAPILTYGPHGSPKRTPQYRTVTTSVTRVAPTIPLASSNTVPILGYGPHGSPKKGPRVTVAAAPPAQEAVFGYGPHGSPKRQVRPAAAQAAVTIPSYAASSAASRFGTHANPPGLAPPAPAPAPSAVLSYGPHGSPKRSTRTITVAPQPDPHEAHMHWLQPSYTPLTMKAGPPLKEVMPMPVEAARPDLKSAPKTTATAKVSAAAPWLDPCLPVKKQVPSFFLDDEPSSTSLTLSQNPPSLRAMAAR